jgi:hypothetical protein
MAYTPLLIISLDLHKLEYFSISKPSSLWPSISLLIYLLFKLSYLLLTTYLFPRTIDNNLCKQLTRLIILSIDVDSTLLIFPLVILSMHAISLSIYTGSILALLNITLLSLELLLSKLSHYTSEYRLPSPLWDRQYYGLIVLFSSALVYSLQSVLPDRLAVHAGNIGIVGGMAGIVACIVLGGNYIMDRCVLRENIAMVSVGIGISVLRIGNGGGGGGGGNGAIGVIVGLGIAMSATAVWERRVEGLGRGHKNRVKARKLSNYVRDIVYNTDRVDNIKCRYRLINSLHAHIDECTNVSCLCRMMLFKHPTNYQGELIQSLAAEWEQNNLPFGHGYPFTYCKSNELMDRLVAQRSTLTKYLSDISALQSHSKNRFVGGDKFSAEKFTSSLFVFSTKTIHLVCSSMLHEGIASCRGRKDEVEMLREELISLYSSVLHSPLTALILSLSSPPPSSTPLQSVLSTLFNTREYRQWIIRDRLDNKYRMNREYTRIIDDIKLQDSVPNIIIDIEKTALDKLAYYNCLLSRPPHYSRVVQLSTQIYDSMQILNEKIKILPNGQSTDRIKNMYSLLIMEDFVHGKLEDVVHKPIHMDRPEDHMPTISVSLMSPPPYTIQSVTNLPQTLVNQPLNNILPPAMHSFHDGMITRFIARGYSNPGGQIQGVILYDNSSLVVDVKIVLDYSLCTGPVLHTRLSPITPQPSLCTDMQGHSLTPLPQNFFPGCTDRNIFTYIPSLYNDFNECAQRGSGDQEQNSILKEYACLTNPSSNMAISMSLLPSAQAMCIQIQSVSTLCPTLEETIVKIQSLKEGINEHSPLEKNKFKTLETVSPKIFSPLLTFPSYAPPPTPSRSYFLSNLSTGINASPNPKSHPTVEAQKALYSLPQHSTEEILLLTNPVHQIQMPNMVESIASSKITSNVSVRALAKVCKEQLRKERLLKRKLLPWSGVLLLSIILCIILKILLENMHYNSVTSTYNTNLRILLLNHVLRPFGVFYKDSAKQRLVLSLPLSPELTARHANFTSLLYTYYRSRLQLWYPPMAITYASQHTLLDLGIPAGSSLLTQSLHRSSLCRCWQAVCSTTSTVSCCR